MPKQFGGASYLDRSFRCRSGVATACFLGKHGRDTNCTNFHETETAENARNAKRSAGGWPIYRNIAPFPKPHLARMPLAVEEDETLNPSPISGLGADRLVFEPQHLTVLFQQF